MSEPKTVLIRRCDGGDYELDMTQEGPVQDALRRIWARRGQPGPEYDEAVSRSRARLASSVR